MLAAAPAAAQVATYTPTPVNTCFTLASLTIGPDRGSGASPLPHELTPRLPEALAACEQAVKERPTEGRLHARVARMRLLSGDGKGAAEAARKGAELGSSTAQVLLGVMHADGVHVPRDYAAARELFRRAAKDRSPHAHFNLGVLFANGWGVERDDEDAAASFRQAALGGDPLAMQLFAQRYDPQQADMWLKKAAEAMYPEGARTAMRLADFGRAAPDAAALVAWYEAKARGGEPWAQAYVGMLHESGQWLGQDYAAAIDWYRRAGTAGNVPAQWRLNRFYWEGRGVARDEAEARRWGEMHQVQRCEARERDAAGANACDRLAADPEVDSYCMRHFAVRAVAACRAAAKEFPSAVRYRAQLARALAHTGNFAEALREARTAAAAGSAPAMVLLGVMSQRGLGTEQDDAAALAWYRKAAEAGEPRGASLAGLPTIHIAPSPAEQAERGDPRAQHNLAAQLEREKKYDEALRWYTRAAEQGFEASAMNLAQMYEKGIGVGQDRAEAMKRYRALAGHGNGEARYRLAKLAADAGQYDEALTAYQRGVRDDDWRAILDLGQLHEEGRGVPKDARRAAQLYERVAERSGWARFKLGTLHLAGSGIPRDYAVAHRWLRRSADDGHAGARNNLGLMYDRGLGVAVDHAAARDLYHAALGDEHARGNLESLYAEGRGAPSGAAAVAWYRRGADAEIAAAQYRLGQIFAKGEGVPRDERAAAHWLARAAHQGHAEARKEAGELYYKLGNYMEAAALGHEGAVHALADQAMKSGQPGAREEYLRWLNAPKPKPPAARAWPTGISLDPGEDQQRTMQVRVAGVGSIQAVAANAAIANVYDIIRWFPETDGKK